MNRINNVLSKRKQIKLRVQTRDHMLSVFSTSTLPSQIKPLNLGISPSQPLFQPPIQPFPATSKARGVSN